MTAGHHPKAFRLLQLSDCHLPPDPSERYRGVNADEGLRTLTVAAAEGGFDAVLVTGDVSERADADSYRRALAALAALDVPLFALPGNHDRPAVMREWFPAGPWDGPLAVPLGHWYLVLLDSTVDGRVDGRIDGQDLDWLEAWLRADGGDAPVLIALHHQPVPVGSPWIDRYMLREPEAFLAVIERSPRVRGVLWGHVHQDFEAPLGTARLLACPSTAANSLPGAGRFTHDPAGPAGRWFELDAAGSLRTGLLRGTGPDDVSAAAGRARG